MSLIIFVGIVVIGTILGIAITLILTRKTEKRK